jgi:hypothetical protein
MQSTFLGGVVKVISSDLECELNQWIQLESAYEMKLPGICIVDIQWLNWPLPIAVLCLCVSLLCSRDLQVACYVCDRQLEYFGAGNAPHTFIYGNVAWM